MLAQCFRSTQSVSKKRPLQSPAFDPTAACVALPAKRKKKAFGGSRVKPSNVTVVMLPKFCYSIPRGKKRKALQEQGRVQVVQFSRSTTPEEVQAAIRSGLNTWSYMCLPTFSVVLKEHSVCHSFRSWMVRVPRHARAACTFVRGNAPGER